MVGRCRLGGTLATRAGRRPTRASLRRFTDVFGQSFWVSSWVAVVHAGAAVLTAYFWLENQREPNAFKRENASWAANWMMTALLAETMLVVPDVILLISMLLNGGESETSVFAFSLLGLFYLVGFVHLIVIIVGVVASRNRIFRPPLALPFFGVTRGV